MFTRSSLIVSLMLALSLEAYAAQVNDSWYHRHAEGWHWYVDPIPPVEEEPAPEPPPPPKEEPKKELPKFDPKPVEPPQPLAFSTEWLAKMIPKYLNKAIDDPTPENVETFYLLQRLAMDKAERFAKVAEEVRIGNKFVDETERRPIANYALYSVGKQAEENRAELMKKIGDMAGIFFFYKEGCRFCEEQAPIVKLLEKQHGFDILAISIGGGELQSAKFDHTIPDTGQAQMLSVEATPTMFLVNPSTNTYALLGSTLVAFPELEERIMTVARRNDWITEEELNKTKPEINTENRIDLAKKLPELLAAVQKDPTKAEDVLAMLEGRDPVKERARLSELPAEDKRSLMDKEGYVSPKDLLKIIKGDWQKPRTDIDFSTSFTKAENSVKAAPVNPQNQEAANVVLQP